MEPNTSLASGAGAGAWALAGRDATRGGPPAGLEGLAAVIAQLAAEDPDQFGDALLAEQVLALERLGTQLDAVKLRWLAAVDARGAAGAEAGTQTTSTASWLRASLRMAPGTASQRVRTARALHCGPLPATAAALAAGEVSYQHAAALADATHDLPAARTAEAEPVLVDAARRLDPSRLRRLAAHLRDVVDPDAAEERTRARLDRRGLWLSPTFDGMVALDGLLDPEAGEAARAALTPLARPTGPDDGRSAAQRRADALGELARHALQAGKLPDSGGLRPQVTVTADLASLLARHGVGAAGGWGGILSGETARMLACDAVVTRAIVHRHPEQTGGRHATCNRQASPGHGTADVDGEASPGHGTADDRDGRASPGPATAEDVDGEASPGPATAEDGDGEASPGHGTADGDGATGVHASRGTGPGGTADQGGLAEHLRAAIALLPPPLGAAVELLDLGRATRVVSPGLRRALAVRDGGCAAAGCDRPPAWTDAHHVEHWLHGGPTSLDNLVLLCRVHHRAVHEGGGHLGRDPTSGRVLLTPPARRVPRRHAARAA
jgi:Domain of unknown function (DUF222)/HNH endonuclease